MSIPPLGGWTEPDLPNGVKIRGLIILFTFDKPIREIIFR